MIVEEQILKDIFSQLPAINGFTSKFSWGNENALNLHLSQIKNTNKYPLIWLIESVGDVDLLKQELERPIKLIIAKESSHKTNTNPIIWETEFETVLNPMLSNIVIALEKSGITSIKDNKYKISRLSNYTENGKETKAIDNWNVIIFEAIVIFKGKRGCIKTIKF